MGLFDFVKKLFSGAGHDPMAEADPPAAVAVSPDRGAKASQTPKLTLADLSARLGVPVEEITAFKPEYREFTIPKRSGGERKIQAPSDATKQFQRRILYRLLGRLKCHPAAQGFQRGKSIVTNALPHTRSVVLIRMDIKDFFTSTSARRVRDYFIRIGWDKQCADLLATACTLQGGLPQGAPTSPRLSNLLNARLDARLWALADKYGGAYTRYADDVTFSLPADDRGTTHAILRITKLAAADEGYKLHQDRKLQIRRSHERQLVTGLVVNYRTHSLDSNATPPPPVRLPRARRRWLRAVRHHLAAGKPATLTPRQLAGWDALEKMIQTQAANL